uniref:Putative odorant-binding protein 12 n=1 Tax=Anthonomus grandis TaxID=7044 RepID=A0A2P9JZF1_ANTGR|nr:putative odorant-binding protein 12 [Anthonomus grandis]
MKVLVLVLFVAAAVKSDISLSPEENARIMEINGACIKESGVSEEVLKGIMTGNFPDDPALKTHLVCFAKTAGLIDENGNPIKDKIIKRMTMRLGDEAKALKVYDKCYIDAATLEESSF